MLKAKAGFCRDIREFFSKRDVIEVDTPVLSRYGTVDPSIASFEVNSAFSKSPLYLQTSPEFAMKKLLCNGSGSIYQICHSFRDGEEGRLHRHEFSMLEWYRVGFTMFDLIDEVEELVLSIFPVKVTSTKKQVFSYSELFLKYLDIDPLVATVIQLQQVAYCNKININKDVMGDDRDSWLNLLMSHLIEPQLGKCGLTFVYGYPASQAALAQLNQDDNRIADRFELYINGVEIANGFQELQDAQEQLRRFQAEQQYRADNGMMQIPYDKELIAALEKGLPFCSGVAVGLDRLFMLRTGAESI
ncbi:MAG: EF-P lysine aminoacylase GenX [Gammaproteobacteria bacterium]|nr:MAG: EF-P lysine aminoacylase GenX [Gammaproteobacteria bacterium]